MKIQIHAHSSIQRREQMAQDAGAVVQSALGHLAERITRVEIHLGDENSEKGGEHDKRCTMEARLNGRQPVAVRHVAGTIDQAIGGAADKLKHSLDHTLGRLSDRRFERGGVRTLSSR
jgi:hypothetical protein